VAGSPILVTWRRSGNTSPESSPESSSADLERVHKEILGFERIEAVSDEMRALMRANGPSWYTSCRRRRPNERGYDALVAISRPQGDADQFGATPRTRLVSGSNRTPLRNGVIGMGAHHGR
jgi:hypothetical protein